MSFLQQLKSQAQALQTQRSAEDERLQEKTTETENACRLVLPYFQDLARQLNVIQPAAPAFSLDGKTPWPAMKLTDFRVDARRKMLRNQEVIDYIAMGWQVLPQVGEPVGGVVSVNFPTDLQRVESRLSMGMVKHDRREIREPGRNVLQAIEFDYITRTRGGITVTTDHDQGKLSLRLLNVAGFGIDNSSWPAVRFNHELLDDLARHLVTRDSRFF